MSRFDYIIEKLRNAPSRAAPFKHFYLENMFSDEDFAEITSCPEIDIGSAADDEDLFGKLDSAGYRIIEFPGCIVDKDAYIDWHETRSLGGQDLHTACEGFGMTLRLVEPKSTILADLKDFLAGEPFNRAVAELCGVEFAKCTVDGGIQKYLDGYEISPHPDVRRKAATFMLNINPHADSEAKSHHTHYLQLKPEYQYVRQFWDKHPDYDRSWLPWDWCETKWLQPKNNSIVIFSPSNETIHAVKADYDHLGGQRTQLYGNLWYPDVKYYKPLEWEKLAGGSLDSIAVKPDLVDASMWLPRLLKRTVLSAITGSKSEKYERKQL